MDELAIVRERLRRQRLMGGDAFAAPADAVRWLGAVQGQEWAEAKWSLAMRTRDCDDAGVEAALARGEIVRTHVLRPTWHLVAAEDLRWLTRLTAPRVNARNARRYAELGLDGTTLARGHDVLAGALADGPPLTRRELGTALEAAGIGVDGQRLAHLVMHAELSLVICSGPRRGKQHTYVLADRAVPAAAAGELEGDAALAELARRYFRSHGPATVRDLAWWASLSVGDARTAIALAAPEVAPAEAVGGEWFDAAGGGGGAGVSSGPLLIPTYDETLVAYRDLRVLIAGGATLDIAFKRPIVVDGETVGTWERTLRPREVVVATTLLARPGAKLRRDLEAAAARFGRFVGLPARLEVAVAKG